MAEIRTVTVTVELVTERSIRMHGLGQDVTHEFGTPEEAQAAMRRAVNAGLDLIGDGTAVELRVNPVLTIAPKPTKAKKGQQG